jgi:hypothetical protein
LLGGVAAPHRSKNLEVLMPIRYLKGRRAANSVAPMLIRSSSP